MRLSEKTVETSFAAQLSQRWSWKPIWFGLTQKQEAVAGFDLCTRMCGRLVLFQFKASDYLLERTGDRRFI